MTLEDAIRAAFASGRDEIILRMASYDPPKFQALVKGRDRTKAWGVAVEPDPVAALRRALGASEKPNDIFN